MKTLVSSLLSVMAIVLLTSTSAQAQTNHVKKETVHVYGNCGMCESTIEKSAFKKGVSQADWDRTTKMAVITFDSTKTNVKEILKKIADGGYDNDLFTAPDAAYEKLPGCCHYDRKPE